MKLPQHIGIIMDGNGRWAQKRGKPRREGHKKGVQTLKKLARIVGNKGIPYLTVYAFSTENWKRPRPEVNFLLKLFHQTIENEIDELKEEDISIKIIGRRDGLPKYLVDEINKVEKETYENEGLNLNIAFNYGGRAEIIDAANRILQNDQVDMENITEEKFSDYLYSKRTPDVELLIRTGGEKRISNFLLWQIAYAELYFTDTYWPDFDSDDLEEALEEYSCRERRFGGLKESGE